MCCKVISYTFVIFAVLDLRGKREGLRAWKFFPNISPWPLPPTCFVVVFLQLCGQLCRGLAFRDVTVSLDD